MLLLRRLSSSRWVRYALTVILLGLVIWKVQPQRTAAAITTVRPGLLLAALALTIPFLYLKAWRWHAMLRAGGVSATFRESTLSLVGGMGLALLTPARLGELVRAAYLRDDQKWKIGGLVLIDKGFDVLVLAVLSVAGAWALLGYAAGIAMLLAALAGLCIVFNPRPLERYLGNAGRRLPGSLKIDRILSSLACLQAGRTLLFLLLTALSFLIVLLQFGLVLASWHSPSVEIVFLTFPLVVLTNVLPITIGGLGVREGAAVLLLGHYGVSPAHAALAAFLMFFINTALPGIAGALVLPALPAVAPPAARSLDHP